MSTSGNDDTDRAIERITSKLAQVREADANLELFGACQHQYRLAPPIGASDLAELEARLGIDLPTDYRAFLLQVGDGLVGEHESGGAGPGYGLESVTTADRWAEHLTLPFPLEHSILGAIDIREQDPYWPTWADASDRCTHGSLPLAHYGCGIAARLVVTGKAYGTVWITDETGNIAHVRDHFAYYGYYTGETLHQRTCVADGPHRFVDWYEDWLDGCLSTSEEPNFPEPLLFPEAVVIEPSEEDEPRQVFPSDHNPYALDRGGREYSSIAMVRNLIAVLAAGTLVHLLWQWWQG